MWEMIASNKLGNSPQKEKQFKNEGSEIHV